MKTNLESWFAENAEAVEIGLRVHANTLDGCREGERTLLLSDYELCAAIDKNLVPLPENFMRQQVEVRIRGKRWRTPHYIGTKGKEVIDYVAGQFFAEAARQISGISYMVERAPQLFQVLTSEVIALHAMMNDIKEEFGIEYFPK